MKKIILSLIIFAFMLNLVSAQEGSINVLGVTKENRTTTGAMISLDLELIPGSGRIFVNTFPISTLDMTMVTRFAKQMACKQTGASCDNYDFLYSYRSNYSVIGGSSVGAATTILTISVLQDITPNKEVAITGTINSGGFIGPVGGVKEKIGAAKRAGIKTVLIPNTRLVKDPSQNSKNLVEYGEKIKIEVLEVNSLSDALGHFFDEYENKPIIEYIDSYYSKDMKQLADDSCYVDLDEVDELEDYDEEIANQITELMETSKTAYQDEEYYSAARYCFEATPKYELLKLKADSPTKKAVKKMISDIKGQVTTLKTESHDSKTLEDLEIAMMKRQLLQSVSEYLNLAESSLEQGKMEITLFNLAQAKDRLKRVDAWNSLSGNKGKEFNIDDKQLHTACLNKISEVQERFQHMYLIFLGKTNPEIKDTKAYEYLNEKDYVACLYRASMSKADTSVQINILSTGTDYMDVLLDQKFEFLERAISEQLSQGMKPLLSYTYMQYAKSVREDDKMLALDFAEYAIELSNLDLYFKEDSGEEDTEILKEDVDYTDYYIGLIILLFVIGLLVYWKKSKKK